MSMSEGINCTSEERDDAKSLQLSAASSHLTRGNSRAPAVTTPQSSSTEPSRQYSNAAPFTISPEDEFLSRRVRSLYDSSTTTSLDSNTQHPGQHRRRYANTIATVTPSSQNRPELVDDDEAQLNLENTSCCLTHAITPVEKGHNWAVTGSIEDWENLDGQDVDRYGFITTTYISSSASAPPDPRMAPRRIATALFVQSEQPRKRALKHLRLASSAPEMLQSPPHPRQMREKEDIRSRKWREMAIVKPNPENGISSVQGGGVEWSFSVKDPKLISRTWKGIPDCWRGAAWHCFLTASAQSRGIGKPDTQLAVIYHELLERPSSDDVQIDLDVPRTINSHIMFRKRYRGGQRLLFRVLHSLALYSPDVGYVQGMASLAATLLCYYDEESTFIMLVRLWELRGLEKLYKSGFGGLIDALEEFETVWIKGSQISKKLKTLGVSSTAYGTRWYLTLFNYSIPFAAQLRVWDVFILLGDPDPTSNSKFGGTLDILHATSAAILDGMKCIILKSDFEDAMKNLTSFLPVKDEDMLMKVAKAEWRVRKRRWVN